MAKCFKCKEKLIGREANEFFEALEFNGFTKPICDECYEMECYNEPEQEQYSDADNGL